MQNKLTSWSISRYNDYFKCPAYAKYKHIDKLKEPGSPAMDRGIAIHKMAEDYVKGVSAKLPTELSKFSAEFKIERAEYKKKKWPMIVEDQWAFTSDWGQTQWNDWANCWLRVKVDLARYTDSAHMTVIDHKTGKMSDFKNAEYMLALELYALTALINSGAKDLTVTPQLRYLDQGTVFPNYQLTYSQEDVPRLKKEWQIRVKPMLTDTKFVPRPSKSCQWCHFSKSNNGPCKF